MAINNKPENDANDWQHYKEDLELQLATVNDHSAMVYRLKEDYQSINFDQVAGVRNPLLVKMIDKDRRAAYIR